MDFGLSKEQNDIRNAATSFAEGEFDQDRVDVWERDCQFPIEIWRQACELGFIGMHIPERYGGQGLGCLENTLVIEAFSRKDPGIGLALALSDLGAAIISRFGTDEQAETFLPLICKGKHIPSLAYLEKEPISRLNPFETTAIKDQDGYALNGTKTFVYNITMAGPMIVLCQLLADQGKDEKAAFIFEKEVDGLTITISGERVGMRIIPMGNVTLTDLRVRHENLLGDGRDGQSQLEYSLNEMNIKASAAATGIAQGAFDMALAYAHKRKQFGRNIGSFEAIQRKLVDMSTRIELSRLLTYKAAWDFDSKGKNPALPAMAKKIATETALEVTRNALHIFGGYGYIVDYQIERFYREASMVDIIGLPGYSHEKYLSDYVIGKI